MIVIQYTDGTYGALRGDLKPGQIFVIDSHEHWGPLVVLDKETEVGLAGGTYKVGETAPNWIVRVIS